MKRLGAFIGASFAIVMLATSCASASVTNAVDSAPTDAIASSRCADAELDQNLTAEQYAAEFTKFAETLAKDDEQIADAPFDVHATTLATVGEFVSTTPEGGQAAYARAVCSHTLETSPKYPVEHLTSVLAPGYAGCIGAEAIADPDFTPLFSFDNYLTRDPDNLAALVSFAQLDLATRKIVGLAEEVAPLAEAALEHLCPHVPIVEPSAPAPDSPQFCDEPTDVAGKKGWVLPAIGEVDCDEATTAIAEASKQHAQQQTRVVTYRTRSGTTYMCSGSSAGVFDTEGYSYRCDTADAENIIVWVEDTMP